MFQAIFSREYKVLTTLGERFFCEHQDYIASVLCLDHVFGLPLNIQNATVFEVASVLQPFLIYTRGLSRLAASWDPCLDPALQRLFGFQEDSPNSFVVYEGSRLEEVVLQSRVLATKDLKGVIVRGQDLRHVLKAWIHDHHSQRVESVNFSCRNSRAFFPCAVYTVFGECARGGDCYNAHIPKAELGETWFSCRVRIILQLIMAYQSVSNLDDIRKQLNQQRCILFYSLRVLKVTVYF